MADFNIDDDELNNLLGLSDPVKSKNNDYMPSFIMDAAKDRRRPLITQKQEPLVKEIQLPFLTDYQSTNQIKEIQANQAKEQTDDSLSSIADIEVSEDGISDLDNFQNTIHSTSGQLIQSLNSQKDLTSKVLSDNDKDKNQLETLQNKALNIQYETLLQEKSDLIENLKLQIKTQESRFKDEFSDMTKKHLLQVIQENLRNRWKSLQILKSWIKSSL